MTINDNDVTYIDTTSIVDDVNISFQQAFIMIAIYHRNCLPYCYTFARKFGNRVKSDKYTIHDWLSMIHLHNRKNTVDGNGEATAVDIVDKKNNQHDHDNSLHTIASNVTGYNDIDMNINATEDEEVVHH